MDHEEQSSSSLIRYKSPTFRETETQLLIKLIDKYKNPLLVRSMLSSVTYIKDKAWVELTKEFNSLNTGYNYERTADVLKTKWDNLKRMAKKCSKNVGSDNKLFLNDIVRDVILICEADVGPLDEGESHEGAGKFKDTISIHT